uniref:(northern house mosquito) hypothetical protein n=1 Tax=Culex pipiens TaxID=7175 RepID=A0A8D8H3F0_CULPI
MLDGNSVGGMLMITMKITTTYSPPPECSDKGKGRAEKQEISLIGADYFFSLEAAAVVVEAGRSPSVASVASEPPVTTTGILAPSLPESPGFWTYRISAYSVDSGLAT